VQDSPKPARISYTRPSIGPLEVAYATEAATYGWGERCYEFIDRFESQFAQHLGVRHAIATSSCTGALHMGFAALGIGPGDEVIMGDINWIASVAPIVRLGASPVLVDVRDDSWCLDPAKVLAAITPKTKAILAVHLYGNLCEMDELRAIAAAHNLALIEDAAEAIGSCYDGKRAGSMGTFGTFSFHGTKTVTTGEGGMFVTDDSALFERVLTLSNHGRAKSEARQFWPSTVGFKYKMSNIQAALGCGQLERIDELIAAKRRVFLGYQARLADLPIRMNVEPAGRTNGYWMPNIVVDPSVAFDRAELLRDFQDANIDGRVFFWPLSSLGLFPPEPENVVSYGLFGRSVNLPSYHDLNDDDLDRVCAVVKQHFAR
jgi:perosamine synthetase